MFRFFADSISGQTGKAVTNAGTESDVNKAIGNILGTVFILIGILAVIMIIMGGINYLLSRGDSDKVKKGKNTILYGIIGLLVALLAYAIVGFVTGKFA